MWWLTPGTRAAAMAEAVFNAVWLLVLLFPMAIAAMIAWQEEWAVTAVLLIGLLAGAVVARVAFDLNVAARERRGEPLKSGVLVLRHTVAEETVRAAILLFGLLLAGAAFGMVDVGDGTAVWVATAAWVVALAYLPAAVWWRVSRSGPTPTVWTRRRGIAAVAAAIVVTLAVSAPMAPAGGKSWSRIMLEVLAVGGAGMLWIRWMDARGDRR